jgi:hypothetical protein
MDGNPDFSTLIKWDVTAIPAGSIVQSASITLNVVNTTINSFSIYQLLRNWSESTSNFNLFATGSPWQIAGAQGALDRGTTVLGTASAAALGSYTLNLNSAGIAVVQSWINNPSTNFGFIFQNYLDASTDDMDVSSSNNSNALLRPKLTIGIATPSGSPITSPLKTSPLMTNPDNPFDVNGDSMVTPRDALMVINRLNGSGEAEGNDGGAVAYWDVSGDGVVAPFDILLIINYLNQLLTDDSSDLAGEGEGEAVSFIETPSEDLGQILPDDLNLSVAGILTGALQADSILNLGSLTSSGLVTTCASHSSSESSILEHLPIAYQMLQLEAADSVDEDLLLWDQECDLDVVSEDLLSAADLDDAESNEELASIFAGWPARWDDEAEG